MNGSVLSLSKQDLASRTCSSVDHQKFILSISQIPNFSSEQLTTLQQNIATVYNISVSRVNITQRPNSQNQNTDGQIIISILKSNDSTELQHSAIVYNFTQMVTQDPSKFSTFLMNTNISSTSVKLNTLTFNETVGTQPGCFKKDPTNLSAELLLGLDADCSPPSSSSNPISQIDQTSVTTQIFIGVIIGVLSSIVITVAILIIIPGTRNAIFPFASINKDKKKPIINSQEEDNSNIENNSDKEEDLVS